MLLQAFQLRNLLINFSKNLKYIYNIIAKKLDTIKDNSVIKSVKAFIANTHCIVCGTAFQTARTGKMYCSSRCKQFGYNHKQRINQLISDRNRSINPSSMSFSIDEFNLYNKKQKMLRKLKELSRKKKHWESVDQEIGLRQKIGSPVSDLLWNHYISRRLSEDEDGELYEAEMELEEHLHELIAPELSIEQWSFIKSLYSSLDEISFLELVSSLSSDFFQQLTLENEEKKNEVNLMIRNKFINHCNLIATGVIKFEKKEDVNN
jgi:predicted nucleic acid-binding Zn ribbon protein